MENGKKTFFSPSIAIAVAKSPYRPDGFSLGRAQGVLTHGGKRENENLVDGHNLKSLKNTTYDHLPVFNLWTFNRESVDFPSGKDFQS